MLQDRYITERSGRFVLPMKASAPQRPAALRARRDAAEAYPGLVWDEDDDETAVYDREPSVVVEPERKPIATGSEIVWAKNPRSDPQLPAQDVRRRVDGTRGRAAVFLGLFTLVCVGLAATFVWWVVTARSGGALVLETVPGQVDVLVDNVAVHSGATPITLQGLSRGPHTILVRAAGYRPDSKVVDVSDGVTSRLRISLTEGPPPVGGVRVVTDPVGAQVSVDGRRREGTTPLVVGGLSPGPHTVRVERPPHLAGERVVEVKAGPPQDVAVSLSARSVALQLTSDPPMALFRIEDSEGALHAEGATPDTVGELLSGNAYEIQVTAKGKKAWAKRYTPVGAGPHTLHAELAPAGGDAARSRSSDRSRAPQAAARPARRSSVDSEDAPPVRGAPSPNPERAPLRTERAPVPDGPPHGFLNLNAKPWARVFIDGRDTGQSTPMLGQRLPAGRRKITLVNGRFGIHKEFWVDIREGKTSQLIVDLQQ